MIGYKELNLSFCTLNGVWGDDFHKKFQISRKIFFLNFITFNFLMLLLLHKTLIGSRNIQGFVLIQAVLFIFSFSFFPLLKGREKLPVEQQNCKSHNFPAKFKIYVSNWVNYLTKIFFINFFRNSKSFKAIQFFRWKSKKINNFLRPSQFFLFTLVLWLFSSSLLTIWLLWFIQWVL